LVSRHQQKLKPILCQIAAENGINAEKKNSLCNLENSRAFSNREEHSCFFKLVQNAAQQNHAEISRLLQMYATTCVHEQMCA